MKSNFSPSNPFPISAKAHFWEMLNQDGKSQLHLDFGAHDGKTIIDLVRNGVVKKAIGLDANSEVVKRSQPSLPENVELVTITVGEKLPFPDETFSSVSLFGVLEHIEDPLEFLKNQIASGCCKRIRWYFFIRPLAKGQLRFPFF